LEPSWAKNGPLTPRGRAVQTQPCLVVLSPFSAVPCPVPSRISLGPAGRREGGAARGGEATATPGGGGKMGAPLVFPPAACPTSDTLVSPTRAPRGDPGGGWEDGRPLDLPTCGAACAAVGASASAAALPISRARQANLRGPPSSSKKLPGGIRPTQGSASASPSIASCRRRSSRSTSRRAHRLPIVKLAAVRTQRGLRRSAGVFARGLHASPPI
jgi:hypothetical protein